MLFAVMKTSALRSTMSFAVMSSGMSAVRITDRLSAGPAPAHQPRLTLELGDPLLHSINASTK